MDQVLVRSDNKVVESKKTAYDKEIDDRIRQLKEFHQEV